MTNTPFRRLLKTLGLSIHRRHVNLLSRRAIAATLDIAPLMADIADVHGAFVECGVGNGRTLTILSYFAEQQNRPLYGFDSFQGFPEPSPEDQSPRNPQKGQWGHITPADIYASLSNSGIALKPTLISGYFDKTLPSFSKPIAFLHIDVDLYQSYKDCFQLIPYMSHGGIILFDEYNETNWPGATKAIDELCASHSLTLRQTPVRKKHYIKVL